MRAIILSGGPAHDYPATSRMLAEILGEAQTACEVTERFDALEDGSARGLDLLVLNCARWTCSQTPDWREQWAFHLSEEARRGIVGHLAAGRGILALHCATICFDDWPLWREILGAWWDWGHSGHAPYQEHPMRITEPRSPITEGLDDFDVMDELYTRPRTRDSLEPLMVAEWEGQDHPMLWTRRWGAGRICYLAPGHGVETFANLRYRALLQRCALWAAGPASGTVSADTPSPA